MNDEMRQRKGSEVFSLRLPGAMLDDLRSQAQERGEQLSDIIREAIRLGATPAFAVWPSISVTDHVTVSTTAPLWTGGENHGYSAVVWQQDSEQAEPGVIAA
ncbi:MAG: hypothetical protein WB801_06705 [Candidatus Dormiibacterota bacterium]